MIAALSKQIVEQSQGIDGAELDGFTLREFNSSDALRWFTNRQILRESAPLDQVPCDVSCTCDELWLKVEIVNDTTVKLHCPHAKILPKQIHRDLVRCYRFNRVEFLSWISHESRFQWIADPTQWSGDGIVHFAEASRVDTNLSICLLTGSPNQYVFERLYKLSDSKSNPVVVFTAVPHRLTLDQVKMLQNKDVFVRSFGEIVTEHFPIISLDWVEAILNSRTIPLQPKLELRQIPGGKTARHVCELTGSLLKGERKTVGINQILFLHTLLSGSEVTLHDKRCLVVEKQTLAQLLQIWSELGYIRTNLARTEKPEHRLTKLWGTFIRQMDEIGLGDLFETDASHYILRLSRSEISLGHFNLQNAIERTSKTGKRDDSSYQKQQRNRRQ